MTLYFTINKLLKTKLLFLIDCVTSVRLYVCLSVRLSVWSLSLQQTLGYQTPPLSLMTTFMMMVGTIDYRDSWVVPLCPYVCPSACLSVRLYVWSLSLQQTLGYQTPPLSLMTTFMMMVGTIDYRDSWVVPHSEGHLHFNSLAFIFLSAFVLLMPILLMNLLVSVSRPTQRQQNTTTIRPVQSMYIKHTLSNMNILVSLSRQQITTTTRPVHSLYNANPPHKCLTAHTTSTKHHDNTPRTVHVS